MENNNALDNKLCHFVVKYKIVYFSCILNYGRQIRKLVDFGLFSQKVLPFWPIINDETIKSPDEN